jgi:branched-chain amino acid transport system permease protein
VTLLAQVLQQVVNGLALGSIYALISLGYTMVYGIVRLINFAHGDLLTLGAFIAYFFILAVGINPITLTLAMVLAMVITPLFGYSLERFAYRPLREAPRINSLITAIGASILIENGLRVIPFIGTEFRRFPTLTLNQWVLMQNLDEHGQLIKVTVSQTQLLVFAVAALLMLVLVLIVDKTKTGKAMRATSYDMKAAALMGINVNRIVSITFIIGSALAAAAGILFASSYPQIEPYMGIMPGLKAFVAAVLGGIGSIPGAMLGGLILGLAETLTKGFISSQLSDAVVFLILIIILMVRPSGLLGQTIKEKV